MSFLLSEGFKVEKDLKKRLAYSPDSLKLIHGDFIDNLHNYYLSLMIKGAKVPTLANNSVDSTFGLWDKSTYDLINKVALGVNQKKQMVDQFLRTIYSLSKSGVIDRRRFDPKFQNVLTEVGTLPIEQSGFENLLPNVSKITKTVAVIAVLGISAYILHSVVSLKKMKRVMS